MKLESRWLVYGMCSALALAFLPAVSFAQTSGQSCTAMQMAQHKCDKNQNSKKSDKQGKQKDLYPNATRKEPKVKGLSAKEAKAVNAGLQAANAGDSATAQKDLQPIADKSSNAYAKALANLGLAQVKYRAHDVKGAIAMQKQAIDSNALPNNNYFQALESLAQMYIADNNYSDALTSLNTWNKESGAKSGDVDALRGEALYRLQKYPQAIAAIKQAKASGTKPQASWDQIEMASYFGMNKYAEAAKVGQAALDKDPNNSALMQNVTAAYVNAHEYDKAQALLEKARSSGMIKNSAGYIDLAKMYENVALQSKHPKDNAMKAVSVLKEGMSKGIVKGDSTTYEQLGDAYTIAGDYKNAVAAYGKAAPGAKTGEVDFKRGVALDDLGKNKEARTALKQSVAKGGFKHVGRAYLALGNVELTLKNNAAAKTAFQHAAQDSGTRSEAQKMLKQLGQK